ncbi:MAG: MurR/RpiR family transcriptional regulator [Spirochaetales bacterium]|nr:MurR/RpiR family transcriptional regulator [Spirochaetales bacterium]
MQVNINLIKQILPNLSNSEKKPAIYIVEHTEEVTKLNILELAEKSGSSPSAVSRLCKKLGVAKFSELKVNLAMELSDGEDTSNKSILNLALLKDTEKLIPLITSFTCTNVTLVQSVLSAKMLEKAVTAIEKSNAILLVGIGASGLIAQDLQQKLIRIGIRSQFTYDTDLALVNASTLHENDICFAISYSGDTKIVKNITKVSKDNGATIITLTKVGDNSIRKLSDITLDIPDSEPIYRQSAGVSRINQLVVIDILFTMLIAKRENGIDLLSKTWKEVHSKKNYLD